MIEQKLHRGRSGEQNRSVSGQSFVTLEDRGSSIAVVEL